MFALRALSLLALGWYSLEVSGQWLPAYCTPIHADSTAFGDVIDGIELSGLATFGTGGTAAYADLRYGGPGRIAQLAPGDNYLLSITSGSRADEVYTAWIDLDQDVQFDPDELLGTWTSAQPSDMGTIAFSVPPNVREGYTALRVRCAYQQSVTDPCAPYLHGETEDHTVLISSDAPCIPLLHFGNLEGDQITGVQLSALSSLGTVNDPAPYMDRRDLGTVVNIGVTYNLSITTGPALGDMVAAYIDWNGDGDFSDANELIGQTYANAAYQTVLFTFVVPTSAIQGQHILRVRAWDSGLPSDGCAAWSFGETEDHTVGVRYPGFLCFPVAGSTWGGDEIVSTVILGDTFRSAPRWPFHTIIDTVAQRFTRGGSQSIGILTGDHAPTWYQVWIDANYDGDFNDAGEALSTTLSNAPGQWLNLVFTIPSSMEPGVTYLRVRCSDGSVPAPGSCSNSRTGEIEDHAIVIEDPNGPCIPFAQRWTQDGDYIDGVQLGSIANVGTGGLRGRAYRDHPLSTTILAAGGSYDLIVSSGLDSIQFFDVFIDLNNDGDLSDSDEHVGRTGTTTPGQIDTISFTLPTTVIPGPARMRVRSSNADTAITACADLALAGSGETEDYRVELTNTTGSTDQSDQGATIIPVQATQQILIVLESPPVEVTIDVRDGMGRLIHSTGATGQRTTLDGSTWARGTYLVTVTSRHFRLTRVIAWP